MPKLPSLRGREVVAALKKAGWYESRQRGGHVIMRRDDPAKSVPVPVHSKPLKMGTLRGIIRQADLTVDEFLALL
ncbi:MAG: type II toxin-antitoxin system HicA family toxin [Anaerolineae bacterium]|nr:type II toxin-antitoxin system HicA family toxin [Anaerolineae bacterium]